MYQIIRELVIAKIEKGEIVLFKNWKKSLLILLLASMFAVAMVGCGGGTATPNPPSPDQAVTPDSATPAPDAKPEPTPAPANPNIILATTTSTVDTGLLANAILPAFKDAYGYDVEVISVGTGQAIAIGQAGDADVILVHDRASEDKFVAEGHGVNRRDVMYNDFVIIGPEEDPAGIAGLALEEAFAKLAASGSEFISRGDDSGTHKAELRLWKAAGVATDGDWYIEIGKGMGDTINMANEKLAYTMTDRGTFLKMMNDIDLVIVLAGDDILLNKYGVIPVNPDKNADLNVQGAEDFAEFITSAEGQALIMGYKVNGEQLFFIEDQFLVDKAS